MEVVANNLKKIVKKEIILPTEYGNLSVLYPFLNSLQKSNLNNSYIHRDIDYIDNNSVVSKIYNNLKRNKFYYLFKPESHYYNSTLIFQSIRKNIYSHYYGDKKTMKNPFENCKNTNEIFNLSRNIKTSIKKDLSRIGYKVYKNGEIDIHFSEKSILNKNTNLSQMLRDYINSYESSNESQIKFSKHDYFVSYESFESISSYLQQSQKGYEIKALNNRRIFPMYSVFNPSREDYIEIFNDYLKDLDIKNIKIGLDIGCGSGILSYLMAQKGIEKILSIDNNPNAITCVKNNIETLGYMNRIETKEIDIVSDLEKTKDSKLNLSGNSEFDFIVCNPPWLNATFLFSQNDFDNSIYDPKYKFLEKAINLASKNILI